MALTVQRPPKVPEYSSRQLLLGVQIRKIRKYLRFSRKNTSKWSSTTARTFVKKPGKISCTFNSRTKRPTTNAGKIARALQRAATKRSKGKKASQGGTYTEIIFRCLQEIGETSVKNIYNWMSDTFPDFDSSDVSWKNAVRHTLTVNPLFQKKKSVCGKCHLWYLSRTSINKTEKNILQPFHLENLMNTDIKNSRKLNPEKQNRSMEESFVSNDTNTNNTHDCFTLLEDQHNVNSYQQKYDAENWEISNMDMHDYKTCGQTVDLMLVSKIISEEYYIQEIPSTEFSAEANNYTEPMEVKYLLDENAASIPVQIIEGKSF